MTPNSGEKKKKSQMFWGNMQTQNDAADEGQTPELTSTPETAFARHGRAYTRYFSILSLQNN